MGKEGEGPGIASGPRTAQAAQVHDLAGAQLRAIGRGGEGGQVMDDFKEGVRYALEELSAVYGEGIEETDIWAEYMNEEE